jgi:uncharacterized protein YjbI with pentapeptide repeats
MVSNTVDTQIAKISPIGNIFNVVNNIHLQEYDIYTEIFTSTTEEKSPINTLFITLMGIQETMTLATCNFYRQKNIVDIIRKGLAKIRKENEKKISLELDHLQKNGIEAKREENGIQIIAKDMPKNSSLESMNANNAELNFSRNHLEGSSFARISVSQHGEEILVLIMNLEYANTVGSNIQQINTQSKDFVVSGVSHKAEEVYNLTVAELPEFFANGVLVHNCIDSIRYALEPAMKRRKIDYSKLI